MTMPGGTKEQRTEYRGRANWKLNVVVALHRSNSLLFLFGDGYGPATAVILNERILPPPHVSLTKCTAVERKDKPGRNGNCHEFDKWPMMTKSKTEEWRQCQFGVQDI
jgi:hypothetical protein